MRRNSKLNMFSSGFCFGGLLLAFRHRFPTASPNDIAILIIGISGFLLNLYLGVQNDLWAVRYSAKTRIWLKNNFEKKDI